MSNGITQEERDAIEKFPIIAGDFCQFIDRCQQYDRPHLIQGLSVRLARLCEVAASLPWVEPATDGIEGTPEEISSHVKEYKRLEAILRDKFGALNEDWEIFDPTEKEEPCLGILSGDIAEIYLDLKDGLKLLLSGAAMDDVYFDWRMDFRGHWSQHAASALKVTLFVSDMA
jgi:hypothetical protein